MFVLNFLLFIEFIVMSSVVGLVLEHFDHGLNPFLKLRVQEFRH
jgi:hypothetical protein